VRRGQRHLRRQRHGLLRVNKDFDSLDSFECFDSIERIDRIDRAKS